MEIVTGGINYNLSDAELRESKVIVDGLLV
jgi:hypothetical protein